ARAPAAAASSPLPPKQSPSTETIMAEYRVYQRTSAANFDGTTPETGSYSGIRYLFTTAAIGLVGLWSPADLGRQHVTGLVSVAADQVGGGDTVSVVDAL